MLSHTHGVSQLPHLGLSEQQPSDAAAAKARGKQPRELLEEQALSLTSRLGFLHSKVNKGKMGRNTALCSSLQAEESRRQDALLIAFSLQ